MGKNREEVVVKAKPAKAYTRAQAERALSSGAVPPERFLNMSDPHQRPDSKDPGASKNHGNYHVRAKAWRLMGMTIPEGWTTEDEEKFYASIHYNPAVPDIVVLEPPMDEVVVGDEVSSS